ncbi:hypothetical protein SLS56_010488 [Neofusicoccum ribis]|uniref:BZIP transcription factor n=1 Tax=Neofusicoccum ribis TaxID=45134 RepID=A0ABR3SEG1_9PEZI
MHIRRRTQIRLAQRAYRQRKEMTISSLQKQVEQLQSVIDGMNNSFLRFNDQAMQSDIFALRPHLASELKETTETFVNLSRTAKTVSSEDEREDSQEGSEPSATPQVAAAAPDISSRSYQDVAQPRQNVAQPPNVEAQARVQAQMNSQATHIGMGYYRISDESETPMYGQNADFYPGLDLPSLSASNLEASRGPMITEPRQSQASTFTPSYPFRGINEVDTVNVFRPEDFAPQNTNENNQNSHDFNRVFRLCRHYSSRDELLRDFRSLLQHNVLQPLDFLNSPFLHLGGAGTHYPARDDNGRVLPRQSDWTIRRIGPYATRVQLEELRRSNRPDIIITPQLEDDMVTYGGEWFDSQDVEGYLEELGVHIDAQASFAEAAVRTLDALARAQNPQGENAHPDSEAGVLGEPLDQFAPNHLAATYNMTSPQTQFGGAAAASSPPQGSLPGSASVPGTTGSSGTHGRGSISNGPSTPDSASILQQAAQKLNDNCPMALGEFQPVNPTRYDEWDRFYDLDLAWMGNNQADLNDYGLNIATGDQVEERRQNRSVTIDVQRFINGLIKRGVCIGRGPGFRRADIHYALRAAIIEAF